MTSQQKSTGYISKITAFLGGICVFSLSSVWVFSRYYFLPQSKGMQVWWIGTSKLFVSVNASVNAGLCQPCDKLATSLGCTPPSPYDSWGRLQLPWTLSAGCALVCLCWSSLCYSSSSVVLWKCFGFVFFKDNGRNKKYLALVPLLFYTLNSLNIYS